MKAEVDLGGIARAVVIDRRPDRSVRARIRDNAPHAHYALDREDIRAELSAFYAVCKQIGAKPDWSVWEPFGGAGWHAAIIEALITPRVHIATDISQDCLESISAAHPKVVTRLDDAFRLLRLRVFGSVDWIHADFNLLTLDYLRDDADLRNAFHGLFKSAAKLITFTDTTPYTLLDRDPDQLARWYTDLCRWIQSLFGWTITDTFQWGPAAMHVCQPTISNHHWVHGPYEPMDVRIITQSE